MLIVVGCTMVAIVWQLAALPLFFCPLEPFDAIETGQRQRV